MSILSREKLMKIILLILLTGIIFGLPQAFGEEYPDFIQGFSEDGFEVGSFGYPPYGEKFYHYQYQPFGALSGDSFSRCYFTSDFVLTDNFSSESGHVIFKFPKDTVWPGAYENSTFYVIRSPSFNFPEDNKFEKIIPNKAENGNLVFEFDLVKGLNTFVANYTAFWDSQNSKIIDCLNPLEFEKQEYGYYDLVYSLKTQQNYAKMLGFAENDFLCKPDLVPVLKYDGSPACVKPRTIEKLIDRNWTTSPIVREIALKTMSKNLGPECSQHTIREIQDGTVGDQCRQYLTKLSEEHKSEMESRGYSFDHEQNVWIKDGYPDTMMSIVDYYLQNQSDSKSDKNDSKSTEDSIEWKKYITVSASRIEESQLPDMLKVQHVEELSEIPLLVQLINGADGCKSETEMCALPSGVSIDRTNPLGIQVSDHEDYTISLDKEQTDFLISQLEWTIEGNWIYLVLESQQKYYFVVLSTFDNVRTPDVKMRLIDTSLNPVKMEVGETLQYTIQLETWATYGPAAKIDLRAIQDAKDSGIKVWIEPEVLKIPERSNATATLFIQSSDDAKDGIYDVRVIGHANGNLADLYCSKTVCPIVNIGDSAWSISTFGSGSGKGIGGIETPKNTWLDLDLNKKEFFDGEMAEIKAILVNNSTKKITFTPNELLISVLKTEPVGYYENLYGIEARYESDEPITLEPNSKTLLVRPFYWNQTTFHNFEEEQRLDPKQYKIISKFVGDNYDWSGEAWIEIK